jgi:peptidoglycan hydrolase CwlO-like protein
MILGPVTRVGGRGMPSLLSRAGLILVLVFLLQSTEAMHLNLHANETATNVYNKNLYLQELEKIQAQFKSDLQSVQAKFIKINQELNSTNASSSSQVIKLQETLAEERDALYNIEKYLSLPYALKSCECLNFTEAQKK